MDNIHPTALVGDQVSVGENVTIHPYTVINGDIEIGDGCEIGPFSTIIGWVKIGAKTRIYPGAVIGSEPQDLTYDGTPGLIEIGEKCVLREGTTVHTPVHGDRGEKTIIGDGVYLMVGSHIAHNAKVGNYTIIANSTHLAGYVVIEERVFLSANIGVHQYTRIGAYTMVGAVTKVAQDIPPFMLADGHPCRIRGINVVGLRRGGFDQEQRNRIKAAFKTIFLSRKSFSDACNDVEAKYGDDPNVMRMVHFIRETKRGVMSYYGG